jgi:AcrR family transcriptional regulator
MDMVARRSGLSKSSLYSHFASKQDMLARFFILEFDGLARYAKASLERGKGPAEQFYLALIAITDYLFRRPEILVTLNWVKTWRIELGLGLDILQDLLPIFPGIMASVPGRNKGLADEYMTYWVLFLIIGFLMFPPPLEGSDSKESNRTIRKLFKFLALGIEG